MRFRISGHQNEHLNTPLTADEIGLTIRDHGLHQEYGIVIFLDALRIRGFGSEKSLLMSSECGVRLALFLSVPLTRHRRY